MCLRKWDEYNAHAFRIFKFFKTFCEIGFVLNLGQEPHLFPASRVSLSAEKLTAFFIPPPLPLPPETKLYPAQSPEIYNYSTTIVICNKCTRFLYAIILQSSNISCTESRNLQHNHYNICQIYKTFKCNNRILQELYPAQSPENYNTTIIIYVKYTRLLNAIIEYCRNYIYPAQSPENYNTIIIIYVKCTRLLNAIIQQELYPAQSPELRNLQYNTNIIQ